MSTFAADHRSHELESSHLAGNATARELVEIDFGRSTEIRARETDKIEPGDFLLTPLLRAALWSTALLGCLTATARAANEYIVAEGRSGVIQFIDPVTLKTLRSIFIDVPAASTGLTGILTGPGGQTLYLKGPIGPNAIGADNCCWLYSLDLATLQTKFEADIWGTKSRGGFISSGPGLLQPVSAGTAVPHEKVDAHRWIASPDGRWWFGFKGRQAIDLFDVTKGQITRSFAMPVLDDSSWLTGAWVGTNFYAFTISQGSGLLWSLSPQMTELGDAMPISLPGRAPQCSRLIPAEITASAGHLFIYEVFGGKLDTRTECPAVIGGAWMVEPGTGKPIRQITPDRHFWSLVPNHAGSELYGISNETPNMAGVSELVRLDAKTGEVLQDRMLNSDFWWMTVAPLPGLPGRDASVALPASDSR